MKNPTSLRYLFSIVLFFVFSAFYAQTWVPIAGGISNTSGSPATVYCAAVYKNELYVGGVFDLAGGVPVSHIAKWNGTSWSDVNGGIFAGGVIESMVVDPINDVLYVGGIFSTAGGVAATNVAAWDGTNWTALGSGLGITGSQVNTLEFYNNQIYAGGTFLKSGSNTKTKLIAKWNGSQWNEVVDNIYGIDSTALTGSSRVENIYTYNSSLYVIGTGGVKIKLSIGGNTFGIGRWDGTTWYKGPDDAYILAGGTGGQKYSSYNGELILGGAFTNILATNSIGGSNNIARFNGSQWQTLGAGLGPNGSVGIRGMLEYNSDLFVGGAFTTAGGMPAKNIAKWDGSSWSSIGSGMNRSVYGFINYNSDLYAYGFFDTANAVSAKGIAKYTSAATCNLTATISTPLDTVSSLLDTLGASYKPCSGESNGHLVVKVASNSGTAPYTYSWSNSSQGTTIADTINYIKGLSSGIYSVTVIDALGCTATASMVLDTSAFVWAVSLTRQNPSTVGGTDGAVGADVSCTVCPSPIGTDTYLWTNSLHDTLYFTSNLSKGLYVVTVTLGRTMCTKTDSMQLMDPFSCNLTAVISNPSDTLSGSNSYKPCSGMNNGKLMAQVTGGNVGTLQYLWSINANINDTVAQETAVATDLAGNDTYFVAVEDHVTGCNTVASMVLPESNFNWNISTSGTNPTTVSGTDGTANASVICTTCPSTGTDAFSWSNGQSVANINTLSEGSYTVTVTLRNTLCTKTDVVTLVDPTISGPCDTIIVNGVFSPTNPSTVGGSNGSIFSINVIINGKPSIQQPWAVPITFLWSPGGQTSGTISGLSAGTYTVTTTITQGCTDVDIFTLVDPAPTCSLTAAISGPLDEIGGYSLKPCPGMNNGQILVEVNNGSGNYSYAWSNSMTGTTVTTPLFANYINGIGAGTYQVTVTDNNNGCTAVTNVNLQESNFDWSVSATGTNPTTIGGTDGTADASVTCIVCPSTGTDVFSWSNGQSVANINTLSQGSYTVTVTLKNTLCTKTAVETLVDPLPTCSLTAAISGPLDEIGGYSLKPCPGMNNGQILVEVNNGSGNYSYAWSNSMAGTTVTTPLFANYINGIGAGTYQVTVTDNNNGCTAVTNVNLQESNFDWSVSATGTNPTTIGGTDGTADASVTCIVCPSIGTDAFSWSNGQSVATINTLSQGSYTVTVTLRNTLCTKTTVKTLVDPGTVVYPYITVGTTSGYAGSDVNLLVNFTAGDSAVSALQYDLKLAPGLSFVSISDGPASISATKSSASNIIGGDTLRVLVFGFNTNTINSGIIDTIKLHINGGTIPGTLPVPVSGVVLNNVIGSTVTAGTHIDGSVIVNACSLAASTSVVQHVQCKGGSNGSATVNATGGSSYSYIWSTGVTTPTAGNLIAGTYTVTVYESSCIVTKMVTVTEPSTTVTAVASSTPANCGSSDGSVNVLANGGTAPYSYLWNTGGATSSTVNSLAMGIYSVTITDIQGCTMVTNTMVNNSGAQTLSSGTITNLSCNGVANGSAAVNITGGTAPYSYTWNSGANGTTSGNQLNETGLLASTYNVTVTDNNNCIAVTSVTITEPLAIAISTPTTTPTCATSSGSININATGGTGTFSYNWSTGQTVAYITNLSAPTYSLTITDGNNCTATTTVNIPSGSVVIPSASGTPTAVCVGSTVQLDASGSTNGTLYNWQPSTDLNDNTLVNPVATPNALVTYTVTVSNTSGCSSTTTVTITVIPLPIVTLNPTSTAICSGTSANLSASGGVVYIWTPSTSLNNSIISNPVATPASTTTYTVNVKNSNNCSKTATVTVTVDPIPTTPTITFNTGTLTSSSATGNQWYLNGTLISGATGQMYTPTQTGNYTVVVTQSGCSSSASSPYNFIFTGVASEIGLSQLMLMPNPNSGEFELSFINAERNTVIIEISSVIGQIVYTEQLKDFSGNYKKRIDLAEKHRGIYMLQIRSEQQVITKRIIVD